VQGKGEGAFEKSLKNHTNLVAKCQVSAQGANPVPSIIDGRYQETLIIRGGKILWSAPYLGRELENKLGEKIHSTTKCVENGIKLKQSFRASPRLPVLYALQAALPGLADRSGQRWPPAGRLSKLLR
jgi:hypothetical protein